MEYDCVCNKRSIFAYPPPSSDNNVIYEQPLVKRSRLYFGSVDGEDARDVRVDASIADDLSELVETDLPIGVLVQVKDGLVHNLLQLSVCQVLASHHLEHLEQLAVGDEAIPVHVVNPEHELQLLVTLVITDCDLCQTKYELFEI